jgi:glycosyltransferase involved in cell wall biosynthesis
MAAGLPAVMSDGPGNRDVVVDGQTGIVAAVSDVGQFASGLVELASNDERRQDFGEVAVRVIARYAWPQVAVEYLEAFSGLSPVGKGGG